MEDMNIFDLVVVTLVTVLGLKGLFRGFTKEFFALVGIIGGVFIASRLSNDVGEIINEIIPIQNENTLLLAGFILALATFWIIAYILGLILEKVFKMSGLGFFDRLLGFVFGAGKIFLLFSIIAYAVAQFKPKLENSIMFPILIKTGSYIIKLDTSDFQEEVTKKIIDVVVDATKESIVEISIEELEKKAIELKRQSEGTINAEQ